MRIIRGVTLYPGTLYILNLLNDEVFWINIQNYFSIYNLIVSLVSSEDQL